MSRTPVDGCPERAPGVGRWVSATAPLAATAPTAGAVSSWGDSWASTSRRGGLSFNEYRLDHTPSWTRWRPTCDNRYTRDAFLMTGGGFRMHVGCFDRFSNQARRRPPCGTCCTRDDLLMTEEPAGCKPAVSLAGGRRPDSVHPLCRTATRTPPRLHAGGGFTRGERNRQVVLGNDVAPCRGLGRPAAGSDAAERLPAGADSVRQAWHDDHRRLPPNRRPGTQLVRIKPAKHSLISAASLHSSCRLDRFADGLHHPERKRDFNE